MSGTLSSAGKPLTLQELAKMILITDPQPLGFADWAEVYAAAAGTAPRSAILADIKFVETAEKTFTFKIEATPPQPTFEPRFCGPSGAGRITYTPEQLKDAALFLTMRTYMSGDRVSQSAALVAHAYLQEIGVLPRD
jgi:hypothetical protein